MKIVQKGVKNEAVKLRPQRVNNAECTDCYKGSTTNLYNKPIQNLMPTYPTKTDYKAVF